jgi:FKBP-type peptidyl-prolyl cis-trans isomerase FklB
MLMTEAQMRATLLSAQFEMKKQASPQIEKTKEIAEKNRKEGEAFLAGNKTKDGVFTLESGIQYKILKAGDGPKPTPTTPSSAISPSRRQEFDSSHSRGEPATFPVTGVIKGWTEALQLMPVGSKWQSSFLSSRLWRTWRRAAVGPRHLHLRGGAGLASKQVLRGRRSSQGEIHMPSGVQDCTRPRSPERDFPREESIAPC